MSAQPDAPTFDCASDAELEWVQLGLDAIERLLPDAQRIMAFTEWYLRQRKALLERSVPQ